MNDPIQIQEFDYSRMRNADAGQIFGRLLNDFFPITIEMLVPGIRLFEQDYIAFTEAFRQMTASVETEPMHDLDRLRNHTLTDLFHGVSTALLNPSENVKDAAHRVDTALKPYGNPAKLTVDAKTRIITEMIEALLAPELASCYTYLRAVRDTIDHLTEANNRYDRLYDERLAEIEARGHGITATARAQVNASARNVAMAINAHIWLFRDGTLDDAARRANTILDDARHTMHRRAAHPGEPAPEPGEGGAAPAGEGNQ